MSETWTPVQLDEDGEAYFVGESDGVAFPPADGVYVYPFPGIVFEFTKGGQGFHIRAVQLDGWETKQKENPLMSGFATPIDAGKACYVIDRGGHYHPMKVQGVPQHGLVQFQLGSSEPFQLNPAAVRAVYDACKDALVQGGGPHVRNSS